MSFSLDIITHYLHRGEKGGGGSKERKTYEYEYIIKGMELTIVLPHDMTTIVSNQQ
jgi:hypothetical protein